MCREIKESKTNSILFGIVIALLIAMIPNAIYAGEYLKNARVASGYTQTTPYSYNNKQRTVAPYVSIKTVNTEGQFRYTIYYSSNGTDAKASTVSSDVKQVKKLTTGVTLPSGYYVQQGYIKTKLEALYTDSAKGTPADFTINFLRCSYEN